jgi:ATP synthase protein I
MPRCDSEARTPSCGGKNCTCEHCFCDNLDAVIERKLQARRGRPGDAWYGVGLFGLVGWGVAVPTLAGVALGAWLDRAYPRPFSWTLMGLGLGILLGCVNALSWISREQRAIQGPEKTPAPEPRKEPDDAPDPR